MFQSRLSLPEDIVFRKLLRWGFSSFLIIAMVVSVIQLPEKSRQEREKLPSQLTALQFKKKPPPPPKVKKQEIVKRPPIEEIKPPERKPVPKPKPMPASQVAKVPEQKKPPPTMKERAVAREEASRAGVMAMKDQLQALRTLTAAPVDLPVARKLEVSATTQSGQMTDRLVAKASSEARAQARSNLGTVQASVNHSTEVFQHVNTSDGQTLAASRHPIERDIERHSERQQGKRDESDIRKIFEQNKSSIYALYARAQRQNEALEGKLVLEIKIDANGKVILCQPIATEIDDDNLVQKIIARVKMFDFGQADVDELTMQYTFDFIAT